MAGASSLLARRYIEFSATGVARVITETKRISKELRDQIKEYNAVQKAVKDLKQQRENARIKSIAENMLMTRGDRFNAMADNAKKAFQIMTVATMGWVAAGMQGTVEAYQLQQSITYLSREIAGIFKPTITSIINGIRQLTQWFRSLSSEQQGQIRKFIIWTAGVLGGVVVLNQLRKAFMMARVMALAFQASLGPIGWAMIALGIVFAQNESHWHVLERLINLIAKALGPMVEGLESALNVVDQITQFKMPSGSSIIKSVMNLGPMAMLNQAPRLFGGKSFSDMIFGSDSKKGGGNRDQLALNQTGFESIGAAWDRMSNEVMRQEPMKRMDENINFIWQFMQNMDPAFRWGKKKEVTF